MKQDVVDAVGKALKAMGVEPGVRVDVEFPKEEKFGDLSTPVAMSLAKTLGRAPREIATDIVKNMSDEGVFEKTEIAGPGFINFTFRKEFLHASLKALLKEGRDFLRIDIGGGPKDPGGVRKRKPDGAASLGARKRCRGGQRPL
jgi:arginyl-tRNA synthetase